jgi:predicted oxidoreductase
VVPGDIGSFAGLRTDAHARALDAQSRPIEGLYVAGNDAASFMGGTYPGAGITLGPAMVFGHIAARHAVLRLSTA